MDLNLPLVSFVVTSYNYENYITKTLQSIKDQTYSPIEIIIVDDFSTDNSAIKIEEFILNNPELNIKFIKHDKNYGQLKAIQTGLKESNGEFICFIDSDDILDKNYTNELVNLHIKTSVAFISAQITEINENDEILTTNSVASFKNENFEYTCLSTKKAPFGGWYWAPMPSAMFRKASIEMILNYKNHEDWKICPDKFMFNFAHLIGGSALLFKPLIAKRRHSKNAGFSNKVTGDKKFNDDKTTKLNIENNKKIRTLTLKFIKENKNLFIEKYGKLNTFGFINSIYISYLHIFTQILNYVKKILTP